MPKLNIKTKNRPSTSQTKNTFHKDTKYKWPAHDHNLIIIDMANIAFRIGHTVPPKKITLTSRHRTMTFNPLIVKHLFNLIVSNAINIQASLIALCFEGTRLNNPRFKIYPNYKGKRPSTSHIDLTGELKIIYSLFKLMNNTMLIVPEIGEADDGISFVINTLRHYPNNFKKAYLLSHDKDMYQLFAPNDPFYLGINTVTTQAISQTYYDYNAHAHEFFDGINPQLFIIYKSLMGDVSDNIKGVHSIGHKRALQIIKYLYKLNIDLNNLNILSDIISNYINEHWKFLKATPLTIYNLLKQNIKLVKLYPEWITNVDFGSEQKDQFNKLIKALKLHKSNYLKGRIKEWALSYQPIPYHQQIFKQAVDDNRQHNIRHLIKQSIID